MKEGTRYRIVWAFGPTHPYHGIFRAKYALGRHSPAWWQFEDGLLVNPSHVANVQAVAD
jgi:hypothetical protein